MDPPQTLAPLVDWSGQTVTLEQVQALSPTVTALNVSRASLVGDAGAIVAALCRLPLKLLLARHVVFGNDDGVAAHSALLARLVSVMSLEMVDVSDTKATKEAVYTLVGVLGARLAVRRIVLGRPPALLLDDYNQHVRDMLDRLPPRIELGVTSSTGVEGWLHGRKGNFAEVAKLVSAGQKPPDVRTDINDAADPSLTPSLPATRAPPKPWARRPATVAAPAVPTVVPPETRADL